MKRERSPEHLNTAFATEFKKVDKESLMIYDVVIGEVFNNPKDIRNIVLDQSFINDFVALTKDADIPVEFNHNYYSSAGGKIAFINNVRAKDNKIVGDMQLLASARKSPVYQTNGDTNVVDFVLDSVSEHDKALMLSMKVQSDYFSEDRKTELVQSWSWSSGFQWKTKENGDVYRGNVKMTPKYVAGVDVVGEGALTNSMFSNEQLVECFNTMYQENEEVFKNNIGNLLIADIMANPETKKGFFAEIKEELKELFTMKRENEVVTAPETVEASADQEAQAFDVAQFEQKLTDLETKMATFESENATLKQANADLQEKYDQLASADASEFSGKEGAGGLSTSKKEELPLYARNPINARAMANRVKAN